MNQNAAQQDDSAAADRPAGRQAMQAALHAALVQAQAGVMQAHKDDALRATLVQGAQEVLQAHGSDDAQRTLHLLANLMLGLWIGACFAGKPPASSFHCFRVPGTAEVRESATMDARS